MKLTRPIILVLLCISFVPLVAFGQESIWKFKIDIKEIWIDGEPYIKNGAVHSSPAIGADGTVYVGSEDNKIYALDGKTGSKQWEFETGDRVESSPAIGADGTVYVGSYDNKIYALNPDGTKQWEFETKGDVLSSPAIGADGTVYVGSYDNKIYALNPDGTKQWEFETGDNVNLLPRHWGWWYGVCRVS